MTDETQRRVHIPWDILYIFSVLGLDIMSNNGWEYQFTTQDNGGGDDMNILLKFKYALTIHDLFCNLKLIHKRQLKIMNTPLNHNSINNEDSDLMLSW